MEEFLLKTPATIMFAGPSGCGKTELVKKIVNKPEEVFDRPPKQIILCYSRKQTAYIEIEKSSKIPVKFVQGLPPELETKG